MPNGLGVTNADRFEDGASDKDLGRSAEPPLVDASEDTGNDGALKRSVVPSAIDGSGDRVCDGALSGSGKLSVMEDEL
jgi:hypothetical protein